MPRVSTTIIVPIGIEPVPFLSRDGTYVSRGLKYLYRSSGVPKIADLQESRLWERMCVEKF